MAEDLIDIDKRATYHRPRIQAQLSTKIGRVRLDLYGPTREDNRYFRQGQEVEAAHYLDVLIRMAGEVISTTSP